MIWQELGAAQGRTIVDHEEFTRIEGKGGKAFTEFPLDAPQLAGGRKAGSWSVGARFGKGRDRSTVGG